MITTFKELRFFIKADDIMNDQVYPKSLIKSLLFPCLIKKFLHNLRWLEYLEYKRKHNVAFMPLYLLCRIRYNRLKNKTGFDIPPNTIGYGVRIGHLSTIVINGNARIGNYCSFGNNIVIADANHKNIGDFVQFGSNVVVAKQIDIADGCKVSSSSFVNKDISNPNQLWGGVPARFIKDCNTWINEYPYQEEYQRCEDLKNKMI